MKVLRSRIKVKKMLESLHSPLSLALERDQKEREVIRVQGFLKSQIQELLVLNSL